MTTKIAVVGLLFFVVLVAGCGRDNHGSPRLPTPPPSAATLSATNTVQQVQAPITPFIGRLESRSGSTLTLQDGNGGGLLTVVVQPNTVIDGATSGPNYARLQDHDLQRLKPGQHLDGPAHRQPDGSLLATAVNINAWVPRGAQVVATGPNYVDVHVQLDRMHMSFRPETMRLMVAPQATVEILARGGQRTPANIAQLKPGEYVTFDGAQADDGTFVLFDLYLGASNVLSPTPPPP